MMQAMEAISAGLTPQVAGTPLQGRLSRRKGPFRVGPRSPAPANGYSGSPLTPAHQGIPHATASVPAAGAATSPRPYPLLGAAASAYTPRASAASSRHWSKRPNTPGQRRQLVTESAPAAGHSDGREAGREQPDVAQEDAHFTDANAAGAMRAPRLDAAAAATVERPRKQPPSALQPATPTAAQTAGPAVPRVPPASGKRTSSAAAAATPPTIARNPLDADSSDGKPAAANSMAPPRPTSKPARRVFAQASATMLAPAMADLWRAHEQVIEVRNSVLAVASPEQPLRYIWFAVVRRRVRGNRATAVAWHSSWHRRRGTALASAT